MGRLLTIKEFAEAAGVSHQTIYKQFNSRLKKYSTVENGKKMLDSAALELFFLQDNQEQDCATLNPNSTENCATCATVAQPQPRGDQQQIGANGATEELIQILKNELEQKNSLIAELNKRLEESNRNLSQEQQLRALEHQRLLELQETISTDSGKAIEEDKPRKKRFLDFFKRK